MKSNRILLLLFVLSLMMGCGGGGGGSSSSSSSGSQTTATLVSISVTPSNPSIALGTTEQFTAIGTFSDKSTQDLTTSVTWSSSATSVATISNAAGSNGQAVSVSTGAITSTTVTATSGTISGSTALTVTGTGSGTANVLSISVNGPVCNSYPNEPCVNVTVCAPGTSNCQTIDGILLDTASYGLRIFKQALNVSFTQETSGSGSLAECVHYADGTSDWGPVQIAGVSLGNEPAVQVPVHVIDYTFATVAGSSSVCPNADKTPSDAGFNGILGIGPFAQDCGSTCVSRTVGQYYTCSGSTCSGTTVPLNSQVQNPVALLPTDNNGVIVQLPSVPSEGSPSVSGSLVIGIGTQSNNSPSGVTAYTLDNNGDFTTTFNNISYSSFLDTGSNGLFFSSPYRASSGPFAGLLPNCSGANSGWFCPPSTTNLSAAIAGASGSASGTVSFQVGNFDTLVSSSNNVFSDIGGTEVGGFDWGLPFHFGRNVYMGLEGKKSSLGSGTYFAY
jgi:hypothetical protein